MTHKQECGCYYKHNDEIVYCPMHKAAPEMLEALEALLEMLANPIADPDVVGTVMKAEQALAQVGE